MRFPWHFPLPFRLLRRRRGAVLAFLAVYGFGFSAFLWVDAVVRNTQAHLRQQSRELLEGDLRVLARRPYSAAETRRIDSLLPATSRRAEVWGFLSMGRTRSQAKLLQVRAISTGYPLFGSFRFQDGFDYARWIRQENRGEILVPPELCAAWSVKPGDTIWLGEKAFRIAAEYLERPGSNFQFWELGSRVYIQLSDMPSTRLDQKGSRIFRYRFFALPPEADLEQTRRGLEAGLPDPELEITAHTDADTELGRTLGMVGGFLQLVALCVFWLAAAGGAFFFRHHLLGERNSIAVLKTLGATPSRVFGWVATQNLAMALGAAALALLLARVETAGSQSWLQSQLGLESHSGFPWQTAALGFALLPLTAFLFSLGDLLAAAHVPAGTLFRPQVTSGLTRLQRLLLLAAQGAFFSGLAFAVSRSWVLTAAAAVSAAAGLALLSLFGAGLLAGFWKRRKHYGYGARVWLGTLYFGREKARAAFLALGFVIFAVALIPSLRRALAEELQAPAGSVAPRLFLIDVQEEQLDTLAHWLRSRGAPPPTLSPMVRARLETVNGKPFRRDSTAMKSVEAQQDRQLRNRGFNLSYRTHLSPSETLTQGKFWIGSASEGGPLPEISVEESFANRLHFHLRDTLSFDVQGVNVAGVITSFRRVHWTSFEPNFFVVFQPGALELAPKTFLGALNGAGKDTEGLLNGLSQAFPGMTVVNLHEAVDRILALLGRLQTLVSVLAGFALIVGVAMLAVVAEAMARDLERPALLLQVLGESPRAMARRMAFQFAVFGACAGCAGVALSQAAAYAVCTALWKIPWTFDWGTSAFAILLALVSGLGCAAYAIGRTGFRSPRALLAEGP